MKRKFDVQRCFGYTNVKGVSVKIKRLTKMNLIEPIEDGENKGKFKKISELH